MKLRIFWAVGGARPLDQPLQGIATALQSLTDTGGTDYHFFHTSATISGHVDRSCVQIVIS